jgi:putative flippase GtrA
MNSPPNANEIPSTDKDITTERSRFVRFLLVGGTAALVNVLSRIAFNFFVTYTAAIVIAYMCGMTTAYVLNKLFVFAPSGRAIHEEYLRFTIVNMAALAQVWLVSIGLAFYTFPWIGLIWHAETIAHIVGVAVPTVASYFGHRHFSFASVPSST